MEPTSSKPLSFIRDRESSSSGDNQRHKDLSIDQDQDPSKLWPSLTCLTAAVQSRWSGLPHPVPETKK